MMTLPTRNDYMHHCYYQLNAFSAQECQSLIETDIQQISASILTKENIEKVEKDTRLTLIKNLAVASEEHWLFKRLNAIVLKANQSFFKFEVDILSAIQLLEYPIGGHYNWHCDIGTGNTSNRKLSIIVFLSDYKSYDGGKLRIPQVNPFPQTQGTIIVFPSYIRHRIEPVTRGVRHSLVAWACGPCFR